MELQVGLKSNFRDYYDYLFNQDENTKVYNRLRSETPKTEALANLSKMGIKTLEIRPIAKLARESQVDRVVVYNDISAHGSASKSICTCAEALIEFPNYLGSTFIENTGGASIKIVHIGKRVFKLLMHNCDSSTLEHGEVVSVIEVANDINFYIREPIYSIDYIPINNVPVAVDFNNVENLNKLGLNKYISAESVYNEVIQAMQRYRYL